MQRVLICLLMLTIATPAAAGVLFEVETQHKTPQGMQTKSTQVAVEGKRMKVRILQPNGTVESETIFLSDQQKMVVLDHASQTYVVLDKQAIAQMGEQMKQAMEQMQSQLENMPEEQRAMVEEMMKEQQEQQDQKEGQQPSLETNEMGEQEVVYGYPSALIEVQRGGQKVSSLWVTDWKNVEGGEELKPVFAEMASFFQKMIDAMPQMGGQQGPMANNPFLAMDKLDGFPVASREYDRQGNVQSESALRGAKQQQFDASEFQPPQGYQQRQMFPGN